MNLENVFFVGFFCTAVGFYFVLSLGGSQRFDVAAPLNAHIETLSSIGDAKGRIVSTAATDMNVNTNIVLLVPGPKKRRNSVVA